MRKTLAVSAAIATVLAIQCPVSAALSPTAGPQGVTALPEIVVAAQALDEARSGIETQTGASTYTIDAATIAATPGGENTLLNQVVMQAPEVTQDSFGQFHVRGEHNGLQYRINGIILPEGISAFGQALDPRLISSLSLVTGALPAEYGLRTAGIIDITTKGGLLQPGGAAALYGGSHGTLQPSLSYGGSAGAISYFFSGDVLRNDLGIESPDGRSNPIHDHTLQYHGFGYFEDILNSSNRLALMLGSSVGRFEIPNQTGLEPTLGLQVNGQSTFPSAALDQHQREVTHFAALSWQHSAGALDVQSSLTARYSSLNFVPDPLGDLLFTGIAQNAFKQNVAYALQSDAAWHLSDAHTLRTGVFLQTDHSISDSTSQVLLTGMAGNPLSGMPTAITDDSGKTEYLYSLYLQDEWKLHADLTINYGVRYDRFTAYSSASQASPRINAVWDVRPGTTLHAGYARYLSPPPFELVGNRDIALFVHTTSPPLSPGATPPLPERANYYDVGAQQKFFDALTVGLDSYYKQSIHLIDEGQFGAPIILTPFNYRFGRQYGVELSASYSTEHLSTYLNLAGQSAEGKTIESAQFNFSPADLSYIATHYIPLDHEQQLTASGGVSWLYHDTRLSADFLVGSGLRASLIQPGGSVIPNGDHLPYYAQVNLGSTHLFHLGSAGTLTARFDIVNLLDRDYQIRNGTGIGVGAPQYGPRRGFFFGLSKSL
jgi:outer membrane receptor protein involved in Fe transport